MTERPILFSAPMVLALLAGTKTQTRRIVKGVPSWDHYGRDIMDWSLSGIHQGEDDLAGTDRWALDVQTEVDDHSRRIIRCPYGAPGDLLWVREACWLFGRWIGQGVTATGRPKRTFNLIGQDVRYENPGYHHTAHYGGAEGWSWRPGIHMPRWASRITLRITDVRVERLKEIGVADCYAEGCFRPDPLKSLGSEVTTRDNARGEYRRIWEAINGPGSWDANPWVWAVTFEVVR